MPSSPLPPDPEGPARSAAPGQHGSMPVRDRLTVGAFVMFTVFVWVQRLVNLAQGDETDVGVSVVLSVGLVGLGVASGLTLVVVGLSGWQPVPVGGAMMWRVAAAVTVAVWAVRAVQITLDWRSPGFVAVHVVLAVVSILLAVGLWRVAGSDTWRLRRTAH